MSVTIQYLKEFGTFDGFDENQRAWVYKLNNRTFKWNRDGLQEEIL